MLLVKLFGALAFAGLFGFLAYHFVYSPLAASLAKLVGVMP